MRAAPGEIDPVLVERRRTTTGYGYLIALSAIPGAAMLARHAEHH